MDLQFIEATPSPSMDSNTSCSSTKALPRDKLISSESPEAKSSGTVSSPGERSGCAAREGTLSPDSKCSICLGEFENKSFTDTCLHPFCFVCLLEWSKVRAVCPLCKQVFKYIIHNVRSFREFEQYEVKQNRSAATQAELQRAGEDERRFRYRTTMSTGWFNQHQRDLESLRRPSVHRRHRSSPRSLPRRPPACNTSAFRREVYASGVRVVVPVAGLRADTSALFYARNPACTHRLVPWLNRELNVLLDGQTVDVYQVLQLILTLIGQVNITSEEFYAHLFPFLGRRCCHFTHELHSFASAAPLDMTRYDERCTYRQPSVVNGDLAAATPDIIDDDDNDDLRINGDSSTLASSRADRHHRSVTGSSGWDSPVPGISGWETPRPPTRRPSRWESRPSGISHPSFQQPRWQDSTSENSCPDTRRPSHRESSLLSNSRSVASRWDSPPSQSIASRWESPPSSNSIPFNRSEAKSFHSRPVNDALSRTRLISSDVLINRENDTSVKRLSHRERLGMERSGGTMSNNGKVTGFRNIGSNNRTDLTVRNTAAKNRTVAGLENTTNNGDQIAIAGTSKGPTGTGITNRGNGETKYAGLGINGGGIIRGIVAVTKPPRFRPRTEPLRTARLRTSAISGRLSVSSDDSDDVMITDITKPYALRSPINIDDDDEEEEESVSRSEVPHQNDQTVDDAALDFDEAQGIDSSLEQSAASVTRVGSKLKRITTSNDDDDYRVHNKQSRPRHRHFNNTSKLATSQQQRDQQERQGEQQCSLTSANVTNDTVVPHVISDSYRKRGRHGHRRRPHHHHHRKHRDQREGRSVDRVLDDHEFVMDSNLMVSTNDKFKVTASDQLNVSRKLKDAATSPLLSSLPLNSFLTDSLLSSAGEGDAAEVGTERGRGAGLGWRGKGEGSEGGCGGEGRGGSERDCGGEERGSPGGCRGKGGGSGWGCGGEEGASERVCGEEGRGAGDELDNGGVEIDTRVISRPRLKSVVVCSSTYVPCSLVTPDCDTDRDDAKDTDDILSNNGHSVKTNDRYKGVRCDNTNSYLCEDINGRRCSSAGSASRDDKLVEENRLVAEEESGVQRASVADCDKNVVIIIDDDDCGVFQRNISCKKNLTGHKNRTGL